MFTITVELGWREESMSVCWSARQTWWQEEHSLQQHHLVIEHPQSGDQFQSLIKYFYTDVYLRGSMKVSLMLSRLSSKSSTAVWKSSKDFRKTSMLLRTPFSLKVGNVLSFRFSIVLAASLNYIIKKKVNDDEACVPDNAIEGVR